MDTATPASTPVYVRAADPGIFGTKIPSSVMFSIAVLLFLMPFAELRCKPSATKKEGDLNERITFDISGSMISFNNSGLGLATGKQWRSSLGGGIGSLFGGNSMSSGMGRQKPNMYAIAALSLGVIGLIFCFVNLKGGGFVSVVAGVLSAGALIGLMLDLQKKIKNPVTDMGFTGNEPPEWAIDKLKDMSLSINFTPWFYVAIAALLAAAFFSYKRMSLSKQ